MSLNGRLQGRLQGHVQRVSAESMEPLPNFTAAALLLALALSTCLYMNLSSNRDTRLVGSASAHQNKTKAHERVVYNSPAKPPDNSGETRGVHPESSRETDISRDSKCTMAPESRFDCARDRLLSQRECAERGCCYGPLPDSAGPPWCFYPSLYPGYKMGPFTPTARGRAAALTRATPSYLPRDIATLLLEVTEETAGCFHLTVSTRYSLSSKDTTQEIKEGPLEFPVDLRVKYK